MTTAPAKSCSWSASSIGLTFQMGCIGTSSSSTDTSDINLSFPLLLHVISSFCVYPAFDMVKDPYTSLDNLIGMGFERLLTSGLDSTALEGLPVIKELVEKVSSFSLRSYSTSIFLFLFFFSSFPLSASSFLFPLSSFNLISFNF